MQKSASKNVYDNIVYYQSNLMKKEGLNNWVNYWAVIKGKWLLFYEPVENDSRPTKLIKTVELPNGSKCSMVPRSKRRFPFSLNNGHGSYYFKCETELERYTWIVCTLLASTGQAPKPVPKSVPKDFSEVVVDPKMAKYGKKIEYSNKKLEQKKTGQKDKIVSKHRIRYAHRLEAKAKGYLSKSEEDLRNNEHSDDEVRRPYSARAPRQGHVREGDYDNYYNYDNGMHRDRDLELRQLRRTSSQSSCSLEIHAQIHSPVQTNSSYPIVSVTETPVMSIVEIENDEFGTVHVIPPDEALPNMVIEEMRGPAPLSARSNKENSSGLKTHVMTHSHSMSDLGKTNLAMSIEDEVVNKEAKPLSASNRTRTGLSGLPSPRLIKKKSHTDKSSNEKNVTRNETGKRSSPRSPLPKSRYSRYNMSASEA